MSLVGQVFGKPVHSKTLEDKSLPLPNAKVGIEVELEKFDFFADVPGWTHKQDGSLRNQGIEFVTNGGVVGAQISESVNTFCRIAKERKWDVGYPRAGIHIHLDVTDLDLEQGQLAALVAHYMMIEHAMLRFAEGNKLNSRRDCGYCVPFDLGQGDFDYLGTFLYSKKVEAKYLREYVGQLSKYQALNLKPLETFGTLEFRALPTTFDEKRIMTWIRLILALKAAALRNETRTPLELMSTLGPYNYLVWMLGDLAKTLLPYIEPEKMWEAVDNVSYLIAAAGQFKNQTKWEKMQAQTVEPNPLLIAKKNKIAPKAKAPAKVPKEFYE